MATRPRETSGASRWAKAHGLSQQKAARRKSFQGVVAAASYRKTKEYLLSHGINAREVMDAPTTFHLRNYAAKAGIDLTPLENAAFSAEGAAQSALQAKEQALTIQQQAEEAERQAAEEMAAAEEAEEAAQARRKSVVDQSPSRKDVKQWIEHGQAAASLESRRNSIDAAVAAKEHAVEAAKDMAERRAEEQRAMEEAAAAKAAKEEAERQAAAAEAARKAEEEAAEAAKSEAAAAAEAAKKAELEAQAAARIAARWMPEMKEEAEAAATEAAAAAEAARIAAEHEAELVKRAEAEAAEAAKLAEAAESARKAEADAVEAAQRAEAEAAEAAQRAAKEAEAAEAEGKQAKEEATRQLESALRPGLLERANSDTIRSALQAARQAGVEEELIDVAIVALKKLEEREAAEATKKEAEERETAEAEERAAARRKSEAAERQAAAIAAAQEKRKQAAALIEQAERAEKDLSDAQDLVARTRAALFIQAMVRRWQQNRIFYHAWHCVVTMQKLYRSRVIRGVIHRLRKYLTLLKAGAMFQKLPSKGGAPNFRFVWLDDDLKTLCWAVPPSGNNALQAMLAPKNPFGSMDVLRSDSFHNENLKKRKADLTLSLLKCSKVYEAKKTTSFQKCKAKLNPNHCFSLVGNSRILDLIAPSRRVRDDWMWGLRMLVSHWTIESTLEGVKGQRELMGIDDLSCRRTKFRALDILGAEYYELEVDVIRSAHGMGIVIDAACNTIVKLTPGGAGERAGLQERDVVCVVDGTPVTAIEDGYLTPLALVTSVVDPSKDSVHFKVKRKFKGGIDVFPEEID